MKTSFYFDQKIKKLESSKNKEEATDVKEMFNKIIQKLDKQGKFSVDPSILILIGILIFLVWILLQSPK